MRDADGAAQEIRGSGVHVQADGRGTQEPQKTKGLDNESLDKAPEREAGEADQDGHIEPVHPDRLTPCPALPAPSRSQPSLRPDPAPAASVRPSPFPCPSLRWLPRPRWPPPPWPGAPRT